MTLAPGEREASLSQALADRDNQTRRAWERHVAVIRDAQAKADQAVDQADAELDQEISRISREYAAAVDEIERDAAPAEAPEPVPEPALAAEGLAGTIGEYDQRLADIAKFRELVGEYVASDSLRYDLGQIADEAENAIIKELGGVALTRPAEPAVDPAPYSDEWLAVEAQAGRYYCSMCHKTQVDPDQGIDTCPECAAKIEPELR